MRHVVLLCCVVWFPMILVAQIQQNTIKIIDIETNEPLIGALVEGDCFNGISDESGIVTVNGKPCAITVSYIGYAAATWTPIDDNVWPAVISLKLNNQVIDFVTVTTSRYDQSLSRANVSIDIIKPSLLRSVNATSSDNILNKLPGVQVLDGQANIRGGSGYSYGAGSRVMLLINDMPALQPDAGFSNWSDIPIESLSQIEVVKGAGSALYGSAALNGIINFRSDYATLEPLTRISSGFMSYMTPKDVDKKWWQDTLVYEANFSFLHKQKSGKLDWIVSLFHNRQRSFNQFTSQNRYRGNVSLNYRWTDRLTVALQTIVNTNENSSYFLWRNGASGAMQPFDGTVTERQSLRVYIDPVLTYFDKYDNRHKFLNRSIYIDNNNDNNQDNSSWNQYTEYQFQRNMLDDKLILSLGAVGQWSTVNSQILGDTTFKASTYASYGQIDYNISSKWQVSGGIRYEYVRQESPDNFMGVIIPDGISAQGRWIGRCATNYAVTPYTFARMSFGQGYRFPTLTERFVTTTFGNFSIFSNPGLQSETGWTYEIGLKQMFALGSFKGFVDLAGFMSEYDDMIEFTFVFEPGRLGFQPQNVGNIRISGYEASVIGQATLLNIPIQILTGYTYIDPIYKDFETNEQIRNSVSESVNILKYRARHQIKCDMEADFGRVRFGASWQYTSHIVNIDKAFESVPPINFDLFGLREYRDINDSGFHLLDCRVIFEFKPLSITLLANNILNSEYSLRPALLEAPRHVGIRCDVEI